MLTYKINKINEYTYSINDDNMCTSYLLIGKDKALLIDAGYIDTPSLYEQVRKLTDKEIIVFITHGHSDHVHHLNEFESFFIHKDDLSLIKSKRIIKKAKYFKDLETFDFITFKIKVLFNIGHTKGTVLFIDETSKIIYTGDQFGSGCGVWMQVSTATDISTYLKSIKNFKKYINKNYGNQYDFKLLGGHLGQEYTSILKPYNPLDFHLIDDLEILCKKLLKGKLELKESKAKRFNKEKSYYVCYNNAEMIIRKSLIK